MYHQQFGKKKNFSTNSIQLSFCPSFFDLTHTRDLYMMIELKTFVTDELCNMKLCIKFLHLSPSSMIMVFFNHINEGIEDDLHHVIFKVYTHV